ncbi:MAG: hypothetical protein IKU36_00805 [Bacteroidales bacterium]|nr:hypothetical protein [Bacteroidales bacterium]
MKKILYPALAAIFLAVSCAPIKHAIHVEMRHPSKAGVDIAGKNVSVIYLENDNKTATSFNEAMADGFAYTLEQDYGYPDGTIGVYRMRRIPGGNYASKDSLFNILMDTGADMVFLFDTVKFGSMTVGGPSKVSYTSTPDSSYISEATVPYTIKLYCFDGMDKQERVQAFGGTSMARPEVYSNGKDDSTVATSKAWKALGAEGWEAGLLVADSFKSQWKHEQYSILYYDSEKWYDALEKAEQYDWKGAMEIWIELLDSRDILKRSCAAFNISVSCYMLGDVQLASEWLDRSDADNKLPISDAMRKRIDARLK